MGSVESAEDRTYKTFWTIMTKNVMKNKSSKNTDVKAKMIKSKKAEKIIKKKPKSNDIKAATASNKFDLEVFIKEKLGTKMSSKNKKQTISDSNKSSLSELVKFNTNLAHSFYKVVDEDILETSLHCFQTEKDMTKLKPSVTNTCTELAMYKDLLL